MYLLRTENGKPESREKSKPFTSAALRTLGASGRKRAQIEKMEEEITRVASIP